MNSKELLKRLSRIEDALNAKGHPMQDYSSLKMAVLDLVDICKILIKEPLKKGEDDAQV